MRPILDDIQKEAAFCEDNFPYPLSLFCLGTLQFRLPINTILFLDRSFEVRLVRVSIHGSQLISLRSKLAVYQQARHDLLPGLMVAKPPLAMGAIYKVLYYTARN